MDSVNMSDQENKNSCCAELKETKHIHVTALIYMLLSGLYFLFICLYGESLTELEFKIYLISMLTFGMEVFIVLPMLQYWFYTRCYSEGICSYSVCFIIKMGMFGTFLGLFIKNTHFLLLLPVMHNLIFILGVLFVLYRRVTTRIENSF